MFTSWNAVDYAYIVYTLCTYVLQSFTQLTTFVALTRTQLFFFPELFKKGKKPIIIPDYAQILSNKYLNTSQILHWKWVFKYTSNTFCKILAITNTKYMFTNTKCFFKYSCIKDPWYATHKKVAKRKTTNPKLKISFLI